VFRARAYESAALNQIRRAATLNTGIVNVDEQEVFVGR